MVYKTNKKYVWIADPGASKLKLTHHEFKKHWIQDNGEGIALLLEPSPDFIKQKTLDFDFDEQKEVEKESLWRFLTHYFAPHRRLFWQLIIGLVVGSMIQLALPFFTQAVVDEGIKGKNLRFLWLILMGHFVLMVGHTLISFIQNWIVLHIAISPPYLA